ncbi:MAG TPA: response regulator [Dehalococcoidia bacterium]|nr:response regulator [Dehalococcoidia bacterium]
MSGELVLIVEDNEMNMKLVRDVLQSWGYRTLEAQTARTALSLAVAEPPSLILMDIQLPDLDGIAALDKLREHPATASIAVVALTAFAMNEDEQRFLDAGFDGYLAKPINVREFPSQIRRFCDLAAERTFK